MDSIVGLTEEELKSIEEDREQEEDSEEVTESVSDESAEEDLEEDSEEGPEGDEVEPESDEVEPEEVVDKDIFTPHFTAESVDDAKQKLEDINTRYAELSDDLATKYDDGDLTFAEYRKQERELSKQYTQAQENINRAIIKAEIAADQSNQIAAQKWQWEQDQFFSDNKDFKNDPILYGALDAQLRSMFQDEANKGKTGLQLLKEAGNAVRARFGQKTEEAPKPPKRKTPVVDIPKTLANVPAADTNSESGEFDYMDKLNGMAYEAAIAKMSDDQRARFLAN